MDIANQFLGIEKIGNLMRKYAIPCTISLLADTPYNIVDQILIVNASYPGSHGSATGTVVLFLTVMAPSVAILVGDGYCAFVGISLGRSGVNRAKHNISSIVILAVASNFMLTVVYLFLVNTIIAMFDGTVNEEIFYYSQEYLSCTILGVPFCILGQAMSPIIRADKNPRLVMISTLLGAVINIILNPLSILDFRWGMIDAVVATVLGQVIVTALPIWYLCNMRAIRPGRGDFKLARKICKQMLLLDTTNFPSQISLMAAMAAINNVLCKYSALDPVFGLGEYVQIPMAVIGVVMKFFQIVIPTVVGMATGCIPIVGYDMSVGEAQRIKVLFTRLLIAEAVVGAVALSFTEEFPRQLINIFGMVNESSYCMEFVIKTFRTYLYMTIMTYVNEAYFTFLQTVGKTLTVTMLSIFRKVAFSVRFALFLPVFFELNGVLCSMPVSGVLTSFIAVLIVCKTYGRLNTKGTELT